jgi:hypothetical protein
LIVENEKNRERKDKKKEIKCKDKNRYINPWYKNMDDKIRKICP